MKKADNRERIIKTAREVFTTYGYSKISMDDLAERLGMSKKTLYNHFKSKEDLLNEIIRQFKTELFRIFDTELAVTNISYKEQLRNIFTQVAIKLSSINPYFLEDINKNTSESWSLIQQIKSEAAFTRVEKLLEIGEKGGYIKKEVNRTLVVVLFAGAIETFLNPQFIRQIPQDLHKNMPFSLSAIFEGFCKIIFEGILIQE